MAELPCEVVQPQFNSGVGGLSIFSHRNTLRLANQISDHSEILSS